MSTLYERIEMLCKQKGINITELSRLSWVNRASFTDLKMGRKKALSASSLQKISPHLGVSVDYLLTGDQKEKTSPYDEDLRGEKERELLSIFYSLDSVDQEMIFERARTLAERKERDKKK